MRELRPSNYWNIGKIESWLSDMALKGYFLETMDSIFCDFKEDEPKAISYRIEIAERGNKLSKEQNLKYNKDIWTNVTNYNKFYVFSCPSEFLNSEPNPNPEELGNSLKPIFYKTILNLLVIILGPILFLRFLPYFSSSMLISILKGTSINIVPYVFFIWLFLSLSIDALNQINLIRKLSKGIPINHHAPWRKNYWVCSLMWNVKILLIAGVILFPILLYKIFVPSLDKNLLPAEPNTIPVVRLKAVETADGSDFDESILDGGDYYKSWSALAPKQLYSSESAKTTNNYFSDIDNEYFKLTFPSTQKLIVDSLIDNLNKNYKNWASSETVFFKAEQIENQYIDYLIYGVNPNISENHHVFAAKDGIILHVDYWGNKGKNELIKAVVELFNNKINEI